jgi:hypothetical protein
MQPRRLLALFLTSLALSAHAASDTYYLKFGELMESDYAKKLVDPAIKLYWGAEPAPAFAEVAPPEVYSRSGISLRLFGGGTRDHCVEAFQLALKTMLAAARWRGYDAITDIRVARNGQPMDDPLGFNCKPGYRTTEVALIGSFAMTATALQRAADEEGKSANLPPRPPSAGAIFLPLEPILASAEAKAVLGTLNAYPGISAPAYSKRFGPDEYSEEADLGKLEREEACKQAVLLALSSMVKEAQFRDLDSIIKIRSKLNEQFAPVTTDVECLIGKKTASVTLHASLASRK